MRSWCIHSFLNTVNVENESVCAFRGCVPLMRKFFCVILISNNYIGAMKFYLRKIQNNKNLRKENFYELRYEYHYKRS